MTSSLLSRLRNAQNSPFLWNRPAELAIDRQRVFGREERFPAQRSAPHYRAL